MNVFVHLIIDFSVCVLCSCLCMFVFLILIVPTPNSIRRMVWDIKNTHNINKLFNKYKPIDMNYNINP